MAILGWLAKDHSSSVLAYEMGLRPQWRNDSGLVLRMENGVFCAQWGRITAGETGHAARASDLRQCVGALWESAMADIGCDRGEELDGRALFGQPDRSTGQDT